MRTLMGRHTPPAAQTPGPHEGRRAARQDRPTGSGALDRAVLAGTCALTVTGVLRWVGTGWTTSILLGATAAAVVLVGLWLANRYPGR